MSRIFKTLFQIRYINIPALRGVISAIHFQMKNRFSNDKISMVECDTNFCRQTVNGPLPMYYT